MLLNGNNKSYSTFLFSGRVGGGPFWGPRSDRLGVTFQLTKKKESTVFNIYLITI
jgi:hypothetical protein